MIYVFMYSTSICMPFLGGGDRALNKLNKATPEAYILWGFGENSKEDGLWRTGEVHNGSWPIIVLGKPW